MDDVNPSWPTIRVQLLDIFFVLLGGIQKDAEKVGFATESTEFYDGKCTNSLTFSISYSYTYYIYIYIHMFILIDFSNLLSISYFTSPFILTWVDPAALKRYAGERGEASGDGRRGPAVDGLVDD